MYLLYNLCAHFTDMKVETWEATRPQSHPTRYPLSTGHRSPESAEDIPLTGSESLATSGKKQEREGSPYHPLLTSLLFLHFFKTVNSQRKSWAFGQSP